MWKLLSRLRQKSDIEKKSIAFITALVIAIMILLSWIAAFSFDNDEVEAAGTGKSKLVETAKPVQVLRDQAERVW